MFYVTGDCHSEFLRFNDFNFPEQMEMTKNDYVIICGDFGGVWNKNEESDKEKFKLDLLDSLNFTTLFVCGNHENFDRLNKYPVEMWNGGLVHKIRPSVIHLMRGQYYNIDGTTFFTFGGASSHDIDDGILEEDDERIFEWSKNPFKMFRINHLSWWKEELPSKEEMDEGIKNLSKHDFKVDYIITHECATSTLALYSGGKLKPDYLNDYLEEIRQKTDFKKWIFGHYHDNKNINAKEILIYEQIIPLIDFGKMYQNAT